MNCEHCLRGPSQRKTIDNNHIYKILQLTDNIQTLTMSGGEPTLAMDSLEQVKHCVTYGNCNVNNFYMVTNGKSINVEGLAFWANGMRNACDDNEISAIAFSFDQWHKKTLDWKQEEKQNRNYYNLKEKMEYDYGVTDNGCGDFVCKHSDEKWSNNTLISEGRAIDIGARKKDVEYFGIDDWDGTGDTICVNDTELYLTCSGYLVVGCDWSYHSMDNRKDIRVAHIDDINCTDDLIEAIKTHNKKEEYVGWA